MLHKKIAKPLQLSKIHSAKLQPIPSKLGKPDSDHSHAETDGADRRRKAALPPPRCFFEKQAYESDVVAYDCDQFIHFELPVLPPILGEWLLPRSLVMIHAARGCGKTHFALWLAYAIATGDTVFGWKAGATRKVLYLDGEMAAAPLQERLRKIALSTQKTPGPMLRIANPDLQEGFIPDLSTREGQEKLNAAIEHDTEVIVVDNLSSWTKTGREDAESWAPIAAWALRMRAQGKTVIFIHHSGKAGTQRGTSRREDLLDAVIGLRRITGNGASLGAQFEVHFEKSRNLAGKAVEPFQARLVDGKDGRQAWKWGPIVSERDAQRKEVERLLKKGLSQSDIAKKWGIHRSSISRLLNEPD